MHDSEWGTATRKEKLYDAYLQNRSTANQKHLEVNNIDERGEKLEALEMNCLPYAYQRGLKR